MHERGSEQPNRLAVRPRDAARILGISERTLWSLTKKGEIPHVRTGRVVLYSIAALEEWLAGNQTGGRHDHA